MEEDKRIKNFLETTISCLKGNNDGYVKVYKYNLEILENILNELERLQEENELLIENAIHNDKVVDRCRFENGRLQKENKELSESHNYIYNAYQDAGKKMFDYKEQLNDSIPKQTIRDKIEEIQTRMNDDCIALHEFQRLAKIDVLKELLGE